MEYALTALGSSVRAIRGSISQAEFAKAINIGRKALAAIETGATNPSYLLVERIAAVCDVYVDQVAGRGVFGPGSPNMLYAVRYPYRCLARGAFAPLAMAWVAQMMDNPRPWEAQLATSPQIMADASQGSLPPNIEAQIFSDVRARLMHHSIIDTLSIEPSEPSTPDNQMIERLAKSVWEARARRYLTQVQLALAIDVDTDTVVKIERGKRPPSFLTISAMASAMRLSIDELTGFDARPGSHALDLELPDIGIVHAIYRRVPAIDSAEVMRLTSTAATGDYSPLIVKLEPKTRKWSRR